MNLRTFLPPPAVAVAEATALGDRAPALPGGERAPHRAVVAFLRHTGCPFAEATAQELTVQAARRADVRWIAVSHAPLEATRRWAAAVGLRGVDLVADPERQAYAAWGLGRTGAAHFMGPGSLRAVGALARRGIRNRHPDGTRWQSAGTFAVDDDGIVRWRHVPAHAGELPDLAAAAGAAAPRP